MIWRNKNSFKISWYIPSEKIGQNFYPSKMFFLVFIFNIGLVGMYFGHNWPPRTPEKKVAWGSMGGLNQDSALHTVILSVDMTSLRQS